MECDCQAVASQFFHPFKVLPTSPPADPLGWDPLFEELGSPTTKWRRCGVTVALSRSQTQEPQAGNWQCSATIPLPADLYQPQRALVPCDHHAGLRRSEARQPPCLNTSAHNREAERTGFPFTTCSVVQPGCCVDAVQFARTILLLDAHVEDTDKKSPQHIWARVANFDRLFVDPSRERLSISLCRMDANGTLSPLASTTETRLRCTASSRGPHCSLSVFALEAFVAFDFLKTVACWIFTLDRATAGKYSANPAESRLRLHFAKKNKMWICLGQEDPSRPDEIAWAPECMAIVGQATCHRSTISRKGNATN